MEHEINFHPVIVIIKIEEANESRALNIEHLLAINSENVAALL